MPDELNLFKLEWNGDENPPTIEAVCPLLQSFIHETRLSQHRESV